MEDKLITQFIPADVIEAPLNTKPGASLNQKIEMAIRRYMSNESFTQGDIKEEIPQLFISRCYFDPVRMGYDVIAMLM